MSDQNDEILEAINKRIDDAKKINDEILEAINRRIKELEVEMTPKYATVIRNTKEMLANQFIQDMSEENYYRLQNFCKKHDVSCFMMKGKDFVMFPNDYKYEEHQFNRR